MCNEFDRGLLVSGTVRNLFSSTDAFQFEAMGDVPLKGREENVDIFSVEPGAEG